MSFSQMGSSGSQAPNVDQPQSRMVAVRPPTARPLVTYAILGLTMIVYILQELNWNGMAQAPFLALTAQIFGAENLPILLTNNWGNDLPLLLGGKISELIIEGQYWRLLTPALLHASMAHVGANMFSLFIIGSRLEKFYGHGRFLGLYLLGAIGGNVLSFLLSPGLSVGASTAVFGLLAAEGVFAYRHQTVFGEQAKAMLNNILFLLVLNLGIGLSETRIDNWGHLGGLVTGLAFAWFAGPQLEVSYRYPDYELVDQRGSALVWLVGVALFALLVGVVYLRIQMA